MDRFTALNPPHRGGPRPGGVSLACGAWLVLLAAAAGAQGYPQLHVSALAQRADRAVVAPNETFRVTIHVKISQHRARLDELILGTFTNCEIISNETVGTPVTDGTDFVERLTVQALAPGEATISPAYIDALDPSIGKPMRFSSNALRVTVSGPAPLDRKLHSLVDTGRRLLVALAIAVGFTAAVFVLGVMFVRRRGRRPVVAAPVYVAPPVVATPAPVSANERVMRAAAAFRHERSPAALGEIRGALFALAGVGPGTTLVDALQSLGDRDRALQAALLAAERTMFGPRFERLGAGDDLLAAIDAYTGRQTTSEDAWTR